LDPLRRHSSAFDKTSKRAFSGYMESEGHTPLSQRGDALGRPQSVSVHYYPDRANWPAVSAMATGVFGMVGSEMLPASMLTAMASAHGVSEGMAGQAVTVTAAIALVVSLVVPSATARIDRRLMLLVYSVLLAASNVVVAWSAGYYWMLAGRVVLGVAIGGFWAMSAAAAVRLVPERLAPRALSIVFSGSAAAAVLAAPLGAYFGDLFGWRSVFGVAAVLSLACLLFQLITLPHLPPNTTTRLKTIGDVITRPGIAVGILSATSVYIVHVAFSTYLRPLLESAPGASSESISFAFLMLGIGGVVGTALSGALMERNLRLTLTLMPVVMGVTGLMLAYSSNGVLQQSSWVFVWGFAYGVVPVAWSMWLTHRVPDQRETASGIFVAAVQIAIAVGAGAGGIIFDWSGGSAVYAVGGLFIIASSAAVFRTTKVASAPESARRHAP
jgi:predicted MFS family arabinose efflux permease